MKKQARDKHEQIERYGWDQYKEDEFESSIKGIQNDKWTKFKEIDAKHIVQADEIIGKHELAAIANSIVTMKNCTEDFIINLCYPVFEYLNGKLQSNRFVYKKDANGDIKFLSERYDKVSAGFVDNANIIKKHQIDEKKRLKLISVKKDIRTRVLDNEAISIIEAELKNQSYIVFDITVNENKVILSKGNKELLEVFNEWLQINEYNLFQCSSVKVELLFSKNKKSLGLTVTEINV